MLKQIPTILLVTLVTILIWVFAEAETLRTREVPIQLEFAPDPRGEKALDLRSHPDSVSGGVQVVRGSVTLEGASAAVDAAERILRRPLRFDPSLENVGITLGVEQSLDLQALVRAHHDLSGVSSTIKKVEPSHLTLVVDQLATREIDVRVEVPAGDVEGIPEAKPSRVRLRLPTSRADSLASTISARAIVDPVTVQRLVPGRRETIASVRLEVPQSLAGEREVHFDPPTVEVSLTLRSRTPTSKPQGVPVQLVLAGVEQNAWDITLNPNDQFIPDVTATGPADIIRQIDDRTLPIVALLPLTFQELESGTVTSKDVTFSTMPPTGAALTFDAPHRTVTFTVKRRGQRQ